MIMPYVCVRRRFRNGYVKFLITLAIFLFVSFLIRFHPRITAIANRNPSKARLFCVLINTHSKHERFISMSNITWGKTCQTIEVVRYRRLQRPDEEADIPQARQYVNLWTRILDAIRHSISPHEYLSNNDILIIVPAPTFVFPEKLFKLFPTSINHSQFPIMIIHEQQEGNAYILNGQAINLVRNSEVIDSCLQQSYPSARERYLWKCVKSSVENQSSNSKCDKKNCFIQYQHNPLTLSHIKNGFCLENNLPICRSIVLFYPISINDLLTLEFFKYRLKFRSSSDFE